MLADTAKLAIELNLTGNARAGIAGVSRSLTGLNRQSGQIGAGFKTMGAGIGTAFRNIALLAIPVVTGLGALLVKSVKEGQDAAKVQTIYANAISNSGKVSTQYVKILNDQQLALMNLGGIDDELIKTEQTRLIQMGLTGEQVAKLTPLILDMSKATGKDLLTSTIAVGKPVNGNTAGLQRFGIVIDKDKAKTDAYGATVDALNDKFAGTTKALSGSLEARLGAFREGLANVREEAGMKLLPVLTKIVDVAGRKLVPAFSAFIDRVLPSIITGLDKFAAILEGGGAERGIKAITDALGPMVEMLKIAAAPIKLIVDAFLKLPSEVQGVLIGGFAINKLSGGLFAKGLGQVAGGVLGSGGLLGRGSSPANPLFVSDITGGLGVGGGKFGFLGQALKVTVIGAVAIGGFEAALAASGLLDPSHQRPGDPNKFGSNTFRGTNVVGEQIAHLEGTLGVLEERARGGDKDAQRKLDEVRAEIAELRQDNLKSLAALTFMGNASKDDRAVLTSITPVSITNWAAGARAQRATDERLILQRAVAAGFHPSAEAIKRTLDKNVAHLAAIQKAARDNVDATNALPGRIRNALGGLLYMGGGRPQKDDAYVSGPTPKTNPGSAPQVRNGFTVNAVISTRDINTGQDTRRRAGPTPTQAGAA